MGLIVLAEISLLIILIFTYIFWKQLRYIPTGKTTGICIKVETTINNIHREYEDGHTDNRMYRPIIKYTYNGQIYIAQSIVNYYNPIYFPGDKVKILINNRNKQIVKILSKIKKS